MSIAGIRSPNHLTRKWWTWVRFTKPQKGHPKEGYLWMELGECELGWRVWRVHCGQ